MQQSILSRQDGLLLHQYEKAIARGAKAFIEVGRALLQIKQKKLYLIEYETFAEYCHQRWGFERNYAKRLIHSAEVVENLQNVPTGTFPETERQARPLAQLPVEQQATAWQDVVDECQERGVPVTTAAVEKVVEGYKAQDVRANIETHRSHASEVVGFVLFVAISRLENAIMAEISNWPKDQLEYAKQHIVKLANEF